MSTGKNQGGLNWIIASGIVGADIGTSVFYGTGFLFPKVGYLAPLFVLIVCAMMWLFKRTYEEGLAMSPYNGGAYSMILRSIGRRFAVVAGALTFVSYLATAAVSSLSGGFYLSSLFDGGLSNSTVVLLSFIPLIGFALLNTRGIKEPAKLVTVIAGVHFGLLLIMVVWSLGYIILNYESIDFAKMASIHPSKELTMGMILYGFGAAFLGITGFESAAQIIEELEAPALLSLRNLYTLVIILVSLTAPLISFMCLAIISAEELADPNNLNFLVSILGEKLGGNPLKTIVVVDATLTLYAAVNTAFVGFIGLATTAAKQGNLPSILLKRLAHQYPSIQGYPMIALPFAVIAMIMSALVAGEIDIVTKVYEIAFLGVMVSFCIGVILLRNRGLRKNTPKEFLSKRCLEIFGRTIPMVPLVSVVLLAFATSTLVVNSKSDALLMLTWLLCGILFAMIYFRWGVLEKRLETRSDLRLGLGRFASLTDLPEDLEPYVVCTGGTGARRLINQTLKTILAKESKPFELVIFHAEDGKDPEGFFFELLQRVVSQQIAPIYSNDFVLTVKILPGSLTEGLQTLKTTYNFETVFFGIGRNPFAGQKLGEEIAKELEINVEHIRV